MQKVAMCILGALVFLPAAWPQASSSTVRGTVRDQHQAVVPKASVTLTNTATNVARSTRLRMNPVCTCFPGVFPGPYRLSVESPGMQKYEADLHRPGAAGCDDRRDLAGGPDDHAGGSSGRHADGHHVEPDAGPHARAAAHRTASGERQELSGVPGHRARHRFHRHRAGLWHAHQHQR